jgi:hypothetical protein
MHWDTGNGMVDHKLHPVWNSDIAQASRSVRNPGNGFNNFIVDNIVILFKTRAAQPGGAVVA